MDWSSVPMDFIDSTFASLSEWTKSVMPEGAFTNLVAEGIIPGLGSTQYLPRAVGTRRAKEIIFSGDAFTAEQALTWGLLNRLCSSTNLLSQVMGIANQISANAPIAIREAKQALNFALQSDLKDGYEFELDRYRRTVPTFDRSEGITAFNEKRKAVFRGK